MSVDMSAVSMLPQLRQMDFPASTPPAVDQFNEKLPPTVEPEPSIAHVCNPTRSVSGSSIAAIGTSALLVTRIGC